MKKQYKLKELLFILNKHKIKTPIKVLWTDTRLVIKTPELRTIISYDIDSLRTKEGGLHAIRSLKDSFYEPLESLPYIDLYLPKWF